jgi:hypothetical protein
MLCDLYEKILCGMENSQDFLGFIDVLQHSCTLPCTVDVNIRLMEVQRTKFSQKNSIFYGITWYVLDRQVKTRVLSQVYVSNQSQYKFLLIYS